MLMMSTDLSKSVLDCLNISILSSLLTFQCLELLHDLLVSLSLHQAVFDTAPMRFSEKLLGERQGSWSYEDVVATQCEFDGWRRGFAR